MSGEIIFHRKTDATIPLHPRSLILHGCNNRNRFGAGFTGALIWRYGPMVEHNYRMMYADGKKVRLGDFQVSLYPQLEPLLPPVYIGHMITQDGIYAPDDEDHNEKPFSYWGYEIALGEAIAFTSIQHDRSGKLPPLVIQMPLIGCGLARGDKTEILSITSRLASATGTPIHICTVD